jgi:hypothetical protein
MRLYIGFSKPKKKLFPLFSWLIRLYQRTEYSHVYLKWHSKRFNRWLVYHAAGNSLHFLGEEQARLQLDTVVEYSVELSDDCMFKVVDYCLEKAGTPYDLKAVFGLGIKLSFGLKSNPFANGTKQMFCSELVVRILQQKFALAKPYEPELMTVKDVELLLKRIAAEHPDGCVRQDSHNECNSTQA